MALLRWIVVPLGFHEVKCMIRFYLVELVQWVKIETNKHAIVLAHYGYERVVLVCDVAVAVVADYFHCD